MAIYLAQNNNRTDKTLLVTVNYVDKYERDKAA